MNRTLRTLAYCSSCTGQARQGTPWRHLGESATRTAGSPDRNISDKLTQPRFKLQEIGLVISRDILKFREREFPGSAENGNVYYIKIQKRPIFEK